MKKISVIGLGYVGLVTLCCFSYLGYNVIGTDIDKKKIRQLTNGTCPFYEPELDSLLEKGLQNNTIHFTKDNTVIIDGKNFLDAKTISSYGLKYEGVGRKRNNDVINQNFTTKDLA